AAGVPSTTGGTPALLDLGRLTPSEVFPFEEMDKVVFHIPPANDDGTPVQCALELGFTALAPAQPRQLASRFRAQIEGREDFEEIEFRINFEVTDPIRMFPETVDAGTLTESETSLTREFLVYSSTRAPGERFPPPTAVVFSGGASDAGKFVACGKPIEVPAAE